MKSLNTSAVENSQTHASTLFNACCKSKNANQLIAGEAATVKQGKSVIAADDGKGGWPGYSNQLW